MFVDQYHGVLTKRFVGTAMAAKIVEHDQRFAKEIMRDRIVPKWVREIVEQCARSHRVLVSELLGDSQRKAAVSARHEAFYAVKATKPTLSFPQIGRWFNRDHTSVIHGVSKHQHLYDLPKLTNKTWKGGARPMAKAA